MLTRKKREDSSRFESCSCAKLADPDTHTLRKFTPSGENASADQLGRAPGRATTASRLVRAIATQVSSPAIVPTMRGCLEPVECARHGRRASRARTGRRRCSAQPRRGARTARARLRARREDRRCARPAARRSADGRARRASCRGRARGCRERPSPGSRGSRRGPARQELVLRPDPPARDDARNQPLALLFLEADAALFAYGKA